MDSADQHLQAATKPPLETQDSGISCYTPSPPPKKPSFARHPRVLNRQRELHHGPLSKEPQSRESTTEQSLDPSSIAGNESDDECYNSENISLRRMYRSDKYSPDHMIVDQAGIEFPSSGSHSRASIGTGTRTPDGYQSDVECSSSSADNLSASSSSSRCSSVGYRDLRKVGGNGVEEESEGSVLKVRLKLKSSHPSDITGREKSSKLASRNYSAVHTGSAYEVTSESERRSHDSLTDGKSLSKYTPLPGISHHQSSLGYTDMQTIRTDLADSNTSQETFYRDEQDIKEQRIRKLETPSSQPEVWLRNAVPVPPQSAKTVSRREMRKQQFARRKSASQAEAMATSQSTTGDCVKPDTSAENVLLALRLPDGSRVQNLFKSTDSLHHVIHVAVTRTNSSVEIDNLCLVTNDMPKKELRNITLSIEEAGLKDRTLLNLQELD